MLHIIWFKKDLRLHDHAPLVTAIQAAKAKGEHVIALWVYEPAMWAQPDASARHLQFANQCLDELARKIKSQGGSLLRMHGDMLDILNALYQNLDIFNLYSHEETGNFWSYQRDLAVKNWCTQQNIIWHESPSNGVVRRLISHGGGRDAWSKHWQQRMETPPLPIPENIPWLVNEWLETHDCGEIAIDAFFETIIKNGAQQSQKGGRSFAKKELLSFLQSRGQFYRGSISAPAAATHACSRISPYLTWGALSIKEVLYASAARCQELTTMPKEQQPKNFLASIKSFQGRLHWRCHFIQKLETEPEIEWQNVHAGFNHMRNEAPFEQLPFEDQQKFKAWSEGKTGFPLIDACMRSLIATGWLNFRMRAMLMSFASYQLWLHWRHTGVYLARLFTDYEPGIHWSQCQMQSGVTGINTIRIYNPVKQSEEHDPKGVFIRRWLPELRAVDLNFIHEPWRMPVPPNNYPAPMVDLPSATQAAKAKIYPTKNLEETRVLAKKVFQKHGSRNPNREKPHRNKEKKESGQGELDLG